MVVGVRGVWSVVLLFTAVLSFFLFFFSSLVDGFVSGEQPLSRIAVHMITLELSNSTSIRASPILLGSNGEDAEWVSVDLEHDSPSAGDWVGVFSPANFNSSTCSPESSESENLAPHICTAAIKYKFAKDSDPGYTKTGKASLNFQIINQWADFSFVLFSGGLSNVGSLLHYLCV